MAIGRTTSTGATPLRRSGGRRCSSSRDAAGLPVADLPQHYTLVTGLYPDQHGMVNNTTDPVLGSFSPPNRAANTDGRWWDEGRTHLGDRAKAGFTHRFCFIPRNAGGDSRRAPLVLAAF